MHSTTLIDPATPATESANAMHPAVTLLTTLTGASYRVVISVPLKLKARRAPFEKTLQKAFDVLVGKMLFIAGPLRAQDTPS
jgi:hypothetical protein